MLPATRRKQKGLHAARQLGACAITAGQPGSVRNVPDFE